MRETDPFELWSQAIALDRESKLDESKTRFKIAAERFFSFSKDAPEVSRALFEYSTLMDAFSLIQEARLTRDASNLEGSLTQFGKAAEILRATIHFGFLASYTAACATLETVMSMEENDESFEALKGANALLEQSKLTLSFRDERHFLVRVIDAMIKFSISRCLLVESRMLLEAHDSMSSERKLSQSRAVMKEYEDLAAQSQLEKGRIDYFPVDDWRRALVGAYVSCYPDPDKMWLLNVGASPATIHQIGNDLTSTQIAPQKSHAYDLKGKSGKIRVIYTDLKSGLSFDEGCMMLI